MDVEYLKSKVVQLEAEIVKKAEEITGLQEQITLAKTQMASGKSCSDCKYNCVLFNDDTHISCMAGYCVLCRDNRACDEFEEANELSKYIEENFPDGEQYTFSKQYTGMRVDLHNMLDDMEHMDFYLAFLKQVKALDIWED